MALFLVTIVVPVTDRQGQQTGNVWFPFEPSDPSIDTVERFSRELETLGHVTGTQYDRIRGSRPSAYVKDTVIVGQNGLVTVRLANPRKREEIEAGVVDDVTALAYEQRDRVPL
jgi:hypothetical protein